MRPPWRRGYPLAAWGHSPRGEKSPGDPSRRSGDLALQRLGAGRDYCRIEDDANCPQTESTHVDVARLPSSDTVPEQRPCEGIVDWYVLSTYFPLIVPLPVERKLPLQALPHAVNVYASPRCVIWDVLPQLSRHKPLRSSDSVTLLDCDTAD